MIFSKTNLCQKQHRNLLVAIYKAKDYGLISFDIPFRKFDYNDWYNPNKVGNQLPVFSPTKGHAIEETTKIEESI